ncbi:hypothetical protein [Falsirhodobacter halotolerans]|uniref:hypothetical protein n=1 Tax=Falsirhodobacter halotolerans TaxID=1146892 RepID=UPI001FD62D09|nr:hypothetical protein [Falsirhodobacter halotolerans]MCJ8140485.1 hypothetical protein [Falsirhodobacter halotolerans]
MPDTEAYATDGPKPETPWSPLTTSWINAEWCTPAADTFLFQDSARGTFPALTYLPETVALVGAGDQPIFVPLDFLI